MALTPGQTLGPYEIGSLLGAGGMGEVYRARDTRLHRDVALKVLPPQLAGTTAAFTRFEREAQAVAALSHPNILAIYDFGRTDAASYVVFELLQGATVRQRLESGPLPVRKAVDYARQVADGLAAAHARGITHRDIKPDNLFVTDDGHVKILDFGLAQTAVSHAPDGVTSVQTQAPITDAGTVMGTVGYMAPEQIRAQSVDHRADLFALGVTLYEMCTGRRAFKGATPADTMSAVLTADPPELTLSGQAVPPALDRIVRRCLEKQPAERFQSARDLSFALDALSSLSGPGSGSSPVAGEPAAPGPARRGWALPAAVAALVALAAGIGLGRLLSPPAAPVVAAPTLRAEFEVPFGFTNRSLIALSPDGRRLIHPADGEPGRRQLVMRDLATGQTTPLPDSTDGMVSDWSPGSDAVLFVAGGELRRFDVGDRTTQVVERLPDGFRGLAWLADDTLVLTFLGTDPVRRRALAGGPLTPVVTGTSDVILALPRRIDQRTDHVFAVRNSAAGAANREIVLVRLADGQVTPLADTLSLAVLTAGHLVTQRLQGLAALPFDTTSLTVTGDAVLLDDAVTWDPPTGVAALTASDNGVLAFMKLVERPRQFEWLAGDGRSLGTVGPPDFYGAFDLSPDGARVVARVVPGPSRPLSALRLIDIERNLTSTVTTPEGLVSDPVWSGDGTRIYYRLSDTLMRQSPFSTTAETLLDRAWFPDAFSPDGRWLLAGLADTAARFALKALPTDRLHDPTTISDDGSVSDEGRFSPDGTLVSYQSQRTGRNEVYITPFPVTGERWQVSPDGGVQARWVDNRTLYYLELGGRLMRVAVTSGSPVRIGRPEPMLDLGLDAVSPVLEQYAVHGDRFLVLRPANRASADTVNVVTNWTTLLRTGGSATR